MKGRAKFILVLFSVIVVERSYSQKKVEILGIENNNLYWEVSNPLKVFVEGKVINTSDYTVEVNSGSFIKTDTCIWVNPIDYNTVVTIKNKDGNLIAKKTFRSIHSPMPELSADGLFRGGKIRKQDLLGISGFIAVVRDFPNPPEYRISSFWVKLISGTETRFFFCDGPLISDTAKFYMAKMKSNDLVVFMDFKSIPFRGSFAPLGFEVDDYYNEVFYSYEDLIYDYKDRKYDQHQLLKRNDSIENVFLSNEDYTLFPKFLETNCTCETDMCTTKVSFSIKGKKTLTFQYSYSGDDSVRIKWYKKNVLIADIGYWKNALYGNFSLYYENGKKRVTGGYAIDTILYAETIMRINPVTLADETRHPYRIFNSKEGLWSYFDTKGQLTYSRKFVKDKIVQD